MKAMIPERKLRIQEGQTVGTVVDTPVEGILVVATQEAGGVILEEVTLVVATQGAVTREAAVTPEAVEAVVGDKMMVIGTPRMKKR
jgi:hypothetical protein